MQKHEKIYRSMQLYERVQNYATVCKQGIFYQNNNRKKNHQKLVLLLMFYKYLPVADSG